MDTTFRLETERLYLRCYQPEDSPWYFAMCQRNRAHLTRYESENVVMTVHSQAEAESVIQGFIEDWNADNCYFIGAFDRQTGEFAANIYAAPINRNLPEFEVGYFADVAHEGRGYVSEALQGALRMLFGDLQAQRVRLACDDTNQRSARVAERCGFTLEGHLRQTKRAADGTFSGTLLYGLLRSEYFDNVT